MSNPEFRFDLRGRIRNLGFAPSPMNSVFPLFEAVANGLHAIEERFGRDASKNGEIIVEILRDESSEDEIPPVRGFRVSDNGIGLDDDHWLAFLTADTPLKIKRGGKGVGRLAWLKVLKNAAILSVFDSGDGLKRRSFDFNLDGDEPNPIRNYEEGPAGEIGSPGTTVTLSPFEPAFSAHCPRKSDTIAAHLIGHFLRHFVSYEVPKFRLIDGGAETDLTEFYQENVEDEKTDAVDLTLDGDAVSLDVFHVLLKKALRFHESGKHFLVYIGDGRVVKQQNIDNQLGLSYVGPNKDCVYIGVIASPFLDTHVNQERTRFTFSDEAFDEVHKVAMTGARSYLAEYINELRLKQTETTLGVIKENPLFISLTNDVPKFVEENFSLNTQREEEIYVELSRFRRRQSREVTRDIKSLAEKSGEELEEKIKKITDVLNAEKKGSLAEYVVRRKMILDLLDNSLSYVDPEKRNYLKEERVHELVIPIRSDSDELSYEDHNLWILDDRLAFYSYFKSDRPFRTFLSDSESGREPDVALVFDSSLAFDRAGHDEPIVIVEFKRPGRTSYSAADNPVTQVLDYVKIMRKGGSFVDREGKVRKPIPESTRFVCFVIADFTEQLIDMLETSIAQHRSTDGEGFFGFSAPHNAFVEVLPYSKMLHDARIRNEAFFKKLGLG